MDNLIHRRLITWSSALWKELEKLGFEEMEPTGHNINKTRRFKNGNKHVHSSFHELVLIEIIDNKETIVHQGLSVHDEILIFFTKRGK